jgi:t-SNARE complex subunit (syntaxin)
VDSKVWDPQRQQTLRLEGMTIIVIIIFIIVVVVVVKVTIKKNKKGVSNSSIRES